MKQEVIFQLNGLYVISQEDTEQNKTTVLKLYRHYNNQCTKNCIVLKQEYTIYQKCKGLDLVSQAYNFCINYKFQLKEEEIVGCAMEMEYAPKEDFGKIVYSKLKQEFQSVQKVEMFKNYALQMAKAVLQLHNNNIVHNDIKDDNFFMYDYDLSKQTVNIKIADFGYAGEMINGENRSFQEIYKGLQNKNDSTLSPEQIYIKYDISNKPIDERLSDIYCLGLYLFQAFTRIPVAVVQDAKFQKSIIDIVDIQYLIKKYIKCLDILFQLNQGLFDKTSEILKIILKMLHSDPVKRSSLQDFIEEINKI